MPGPGTALAGEFGHFPDRVYVDQQGMFYVSAFDGITAHAGGGQASAVLLGDQLNGVATVATSGDSVVLPQASPGFTLTIINYGANPAQVFGNATTSDTINGVAGATGISIMPQSIANFYCITAGAWYAEGLGAGYSGSLVTFSTLNGITAHAGGGQASAVPLTAMMNRITTVATAGDSVVLPASYPGLNLTVINAAAVNACNVFPAGTDAINALGASTAFSLAAGKTAEFYCTNTGQWHSILSA